MSGKQPALRARIERTRDGLFTAVYPEAGSGTPDAPAAPDSHIGTTEADVRAWVEQMARWSGFSGVVWEGAPEGGSPPTMF